MVKVGNCTNVWFMIYMYALLDFNDNYFCRLVAEFGFDG